MCRVRTPEWWQRGAEALAALGTKGTLSWAVGVSLFSSTEDRELSCLEALLTLSLPWNIDAPWFSLAAPEIAATSSDGLRMREDDPYLVCGKIS